MKKESKSVVKGRSSAVVLSILIHAALFLLAGLLVVFSVHQKSEKKFVPPPAVERPKMKLKKPRVNVKKSAKPKASSRIVTHVKRANMPDIQLPEMSGMGDRVGGDVGGGFDMMPDLGEISVFGNGQSIGNDFVGTFYDSKRGRNGRVLPVDFTGDEWRGVIHKFLTRDWRPSIFGRYYRSPRNLYATHFIVPVIPSSTAPIAFGDDGAVGALWMVHYKGQLVRKEGVTFRFWGMADEFMAVRVANELVLAFGWADWGESTSEIEQRVIGKLWSSDSADTRKYWAGNNRTVVGDWITLEPGVPLDMEILIGDNGGAASFFLLVEEEGVEYEKGPQGNPMLPAFKTEMISRDVLDLIYKESPAGEFCLTNGPVFRDYGGSGQTQVTLDQSDDAEDSETVAPIVSEATRFRTWSFLDGRAVEAEFVTLIGDKAALKSTAGKIEKVPLEQLSPQDLLYIELARPPSLNINFLNNFKQERFQGGFYETWERHPEDWGRGGFSLKQTSAGEYNHDLQVEMFVVGKQFSRKDAKYQLLDHQKTTFNPAKTSKRFYEFRSPRQINLLHYVDWFGAARGEEYEGYLITVTDKRGEVIAVESSSNWLYENIENLRKISVGNYMDKTCVRTYPARPPVTQY